MDETPLPDVRTHRRAAADEAQNFQSIARVKTSTIEIFAIQYFQVQLYCYAFGLDGEIPQQIPDRGIGPTGPRFAIHLNLNRLCHRRSS
jgi:hypothetical protein